MIKDDFQVVMLLSCFEEHPVYILSLLYIVSALFFKMKKISSVLSVYTLYYEIKKSLI